MDRSFLRSHLSPDETVIWEGRPEKKPFFLKAVFNVLLPFSIVWVCFDLTAILALFSEESQSENFFLIPFFLLHLLPVWLYLGNLIFCFRQYNHTFYLITDKNIYLSGGLFSKQVKVKAIHLISDLQMHVGLVDKFCGTGSIRFSNPMEGYRNGNVPYIEISGISNYETLFRRICALQRGENSDFTDGF